MKMMLQVIALVVLAGLGFWLWTIFFPSPEKIIRRDFADLARDVSFSKDENGLVQIAHAQSVPEFFASNVVVNITIPGHEQETIMGQEQIQQAVVMSHQVATDLRVRFPDINITVAPDQQSATADVTVEADVSGDRNAILQELNFSFQKTGRSWLINKVETVQVLSK